LLRGKEGRTRPALPLPPAEKGEERPRVAEKEKGGGEESKRPERKWSRYFEKEESYSLPGKREKRGQISQGTLF